MGISENLKRGVTELALLCLLSQRDMYGYEMSQALEDYSEGRFTLQESSMYPTLYRLQDKGLVSVRSVPAGKRRVRMYYHLEPSGKEYLEKNLQDYLSVQRGFRGILRGAGVWKDDMLD